MRYGENEPHAGPAGVVSLPKPDVDEMLAFIDQLRERVAAGEFETLWLLAMTPDRKMISVERGKARDKLFKLGQLEAFKYDLITSMDTGAGTGF